MLYPAQPTYYLEICLAKPEREVAVHNALHTVHQRLIVRDKRDIPIRSLGFVFQKYGSIRMLATLDPRTIENRAGKMDDCRIPRGRLVLSLVIKRSIYATYAPPRKAETVRHGVVPRRNDSFPPGADGIDDALVVVMNLAVIRHEILDETPLHVLTTPYVQRNQQNTGIDIRFVSCDADLLLVSTAYQRVEYSGYETVVHIGIEQLRDRIVEHDVAIYVQQPVDIFGQKRTYEQPGI